MSSHSSPSLLTLRIHADRDAWSRFGLTVSTDQWDNGNALVGTTNLQFVRAEPMGIAGWTLVADSENRVSVDGLDTRLVDVGGIAVGPRVEHPLGASRVDHVVVMTPSLDRTCGAITEVTGTPLKRIREVGRGVRQGFHRFGEVILEVVERPDIPPETPARFWGLVLVVNDIAAAYDRLGAEVLTEPKAAVQPGRMISTVRIEASLGIPMALMSD